MGKISKTNTPLDEQNIHRYAEWIFSNKIDAIKIKHAQIISKEDMENYPYWVKNSFDSETRRFVWYREGNAIPIKDEIRLEGYRIKEYLSSRYKELLVEIYNGLLTKDYYDVALVAGKIKYLHWLNEYK